MNIVPLSRAWYSAFPAGESKGLNDTQKNKLYAQTEEQAIALEQKYEENKNNPEILTQLFENIQNGFKIPCEWKLNPLGEWIAENSWYGEGPSMKFKGAHAPLHHLHEIETKIKAGFSNDMEVEQEIVVIPYINIQYTNNQYIYDHSLTILANIDRCALFHIENLKNKVKFHLPPNNENSLCEPHKEVPHLVDDIKRHIFSFVPAKDLITLTRTDKCSRALAALNLKELTREGLFSSVEELKVIWPQQILNWNETAKRYIYLKYLSITGTHAEIKDLKSQFTSVTELDLTNIFDQETFNHILQKFPSVEILNCYAIVLSFTCIFTNNVNNFAILKNCPLKIIKIEGDFKSIEGLDCCTSLEKVIINNCIELKEFNELENLPNLTHLTISKSGISEINFPLPKLVYLHIGSAFVFNDFQFLEGSPNLEMLIVEDNCLDIDQLDHTRAIPTLKLIGFSNEIVTGLPKCTSLTTLVLDTNLSEDLLNLSELNQCFKLETLGLENCTLDDISVFSAHPSLKHLYIKNCGNIPEETIELFKRGGVEVFYDEAIEFSSGI